jgi:hypothetical protein
MRRECAENRPGRAEQAERTSRSVSGLEQVYAGFAGRMCGDAGSAGLRAVGHPLERRKQDVRMASYFPRCVSKLTQSGVFSLHLCPRLFLFRQFSKYKIENACNFSVFNRLERIGGNFGADGRLPSKAKKGT